MKLGITLALAITLVAPAVLLSQSAQAVDSDQGLIVFKQPLQVGDAVSWAKGRNLTLIELSARYASGGQTLNTHYEVPPVAPLPSAPTPDIVTDYGNAISTLLSDLHNEYTDPDSEASTAELSNLESAQADFAAGNRPIKKILVAGSTSDLDNARSDLAVGTVWAKTQYGDWPCSECGPPPPPPPGPPPPPPPPPPPGPPEWEALENPPDCTLPYWPRVVKVKTRAAADWRRYIHQRFKWTQTRLNRLLYCKQNPGWEADAPFNTNQGGNYLGPVLWWSSTYPTPALVEDYLDTNLGNYGYHTWTVGTTSAVWFYPGTYYETHVATLNGNASTDDGAIQGQLTQRAPPDCWSQWCMWPRHHAELS